jgi:hypothetical protein
VRPIAASPNDPLAYSIKGAVDSVTGLVRDVGLRAVSDFVRDAELRELGVVLDSLRPLTVTRPAVSRPPVSSPEGDGDFLSCVRQRESHGDYTIHNSQGSGASGAYQFLPSTWDSIASSSGRADLVGVDPGAAAPADQDAMAAQLYAQQGAAPWGGSC